MAGTVTSTLSLSTQNDSYGYTKTYPYTDGFVVRQEVNGDDGFTKLMAFDVDKGDFTIQGFKTLVITNTGSTTAEIQMANATWTAGTPDSGGTALAYHTMLLNAGEFIFMPNPRLINYSAANSAALGASLDKTPIYLPGMFNSSM